jgi:hypothetical protein
MEKPFDTWLNRGVGAVTLWAAVGGSSIIGSLLARTAGLPTQSVIGFGLGSAFAAIGLVATVGFVASRIPGKQSSAIAPTTGSPLEHYLVEKLKEYETRERRDREALRGANDKPAATTEPVKRISSPKEIAHDVFEELDFTRRIVSAIEGAVFFKKNERFHWLLKELELPPYPEHSGELTVEDRVARIRALVWYYNEEMIRRGAHDRPEQKELYDPWVPWPKNRVT